MSYGRVVIPKEIREIRRIIQDTPLEIFTEGNKIILEKYKFSCSFCNNTKELIEFNGKLICPDCIKKIIKLTKKV